MYPNLSWSLVWSTITESRTWRRLRLFFKRTLPTYTKTKVSRSRRRLRLSLKWRIGSIKNKIREWRNDRNRPDHNDSDTTPQPIPLRTFWLGVVLSLSLLILADILIGLYISKIAFGLEGWHAGLILVLLQSIYVAGSIQQVGEDETGARLFFGKPINNLESGPVFIPLGLFQLTVAPKTNIQIEIPAEGHLIWRSPRNAEGKILDDTIPPDKILMGYRHPVRIPFKRGEGENLGPLEEETIAEVVPVVTGRITDLCKFLSTIGSIPEVRRQLEDEVVSFVFAKLTKTTLRHAMENKQEINKELRNEVDAVVDNKSDKKGWGFDIISANIKEFKTSHNLNAAIESAAIESGLAIGTRKKAEGTRDKKKIEADGTNYELVKIGEGEAAALSAKLDAETTAMTRRKTGYGMKMEPVLAAKTAVDVSNGPSKMIIAGGNQGTVDLITTLAAAQGALDKNTKDSTSSSPAPVTNNV